MITVYYAASPNVFKILIALEELGFSYEKHTVNLRRGAQFEPEFLAISPNNRVPAIIDHEPVGGGEPVSVFESGAILLYLAEKADKLLPQDMRQRTEVYSWMMWQMAGQGPMLGQLGHFRNYAKEKLPYAIDRYHKEGKRLYGVLDRRLEHRDYIIGDSLSMADIICWPWILFRTQHDMDLADYPNLSRWFTFLEARPTFVRALDGYVVSEPPQFDDLARKNLFGLTV